MMAIGVGFVADHWWWSLVRRLVVIIGGGSIAKMSRYEHSGGSCADLCHGRWW